jgi:hypothetical protein
VSLGRFQNCNPLEMDNFRQSGVEDELDIIGSTVRIIHIRHGVRGEPTHREVGS